MQELKTLNLNGVDYEVVDEKAREAASKNAIEGALNIEKGGTGATTADEARSNLGAISADDFITLLANALADAPDISIKSEDGIICLSMGEAGFVVVNGSKIASLMSDTLQFVGTEGKITGLATPTADNHAANKKYVDDEVSTHNQSAATITGGKFAGAVYANRDAGGQEPSYCLLRNSKIVSADTDPTVNGEISWTYK